MRQKQAEAVRPTLFRKKRRRVGHVAVDFTVPWVEAAAAFPASAAVVARVFAPVAGSVAGAFVPPAAASLHWRSVARGADAPAPVSAVVADVADSAFGSACPAVADISDPVSRFPYSARVDARAVEYPSHGSEPEDEEHCFLDDQLADCPDSPDEERYSVHDRATSRRVRREDDMARPLLWLTRLRVPSVVPVCR